MDADTKLREKTTFSSPDALSPQHTQSTPSDNASPQPCPEGVLSHSQQVQSRVESTQDNILGSHMSHGHDSAQ
ncbi:hypothetical protein V6N12_049993 [Hibiscus sabdariffa]|uniref:Uncharacterized protein n=1 Tax=Hibiscus sabdariffa TaxID=183260 RepID=A0ABR2GBN6_9ROSI